MSNFVEKMMRHQQSQVQPLDLSSLDDSLFAQGKTKTRLTRSLKRTQARERLAQEHSAEEEEERPADLSLEKMKSPAR